MWSKKTFQILLPIPVGETGLCSGVPFLIGKKITSVLRMRKSGRRLAFGWVLIDVGFLVRHSTLFSSNGGALQRRDERESLFSKWLSSHTPAKLKPQPYYERSQEVTLVRTTSFVSASLTHWIYNKIIWNQFCWNYELRLLHGKQVEWVIFNTSDLSNRHFGLYCGWEH